MSKVIVDEIQTDTTDGNVRIIPNGSGKLEVKGAGGDDAMLQLNCSAQSHGVKIKSPNHSAGQSYTMILPDNNIEAGKFLKVKSVTGTPANEAVGQLEYADAGGGVTSDATLFNTFAGTDAGSSIDTNPSNEYSSRRNTFFGYKAGAAITTGQGNAFFGDEVGLLATTASANIGFGRQVFKGITTAINNVAFGNQSLDGSLTGENNVTFGSYSLRQVTGGNYNSCLGQTAGALVTTGSYNLLLGYQAGNSQSPSGSITTGSYNVVLGNNSIQNLYCADTSISSSDSRDKTDVTSFTIGLNWIEALRPVTYRWDRRTWYGTDEQPYGTPDGSKKRQRLHIGFLAQEALAVEQANGYGNSNDDSLILNLTDDGMSYGMKYERLVPILVNAIKELSARVKTLEGG